MDHIAIMRKQLGLTEKIRSKEKIIESRWYVSRRAPWDRIKANDTVYIKDSVESVTIRAKVGKVLQFSNLDRGSWRRYSTSITGKTEYKRQRYRNSSRGTRTGR